MLIDPLDVLLGTTNKVKLLRALVPLERPVSGREAARLAGVSRIAQRSLDELAECGILTGVEAAGQHLFTFNHDHALSAALEALFEREAGYTRAVFQRLAGIVDGERRGVVSAVVFGSAARGEAGPESDLDVLVVVEDARAKPAVYDGLVSASGAIKAEFGLRISPVVLTVEQVRKQSAEGDPFISGVVRDARIIAGDALDKVLRG